MEFIGLLLVLAGQPHPHLGFCFDHAVFFEPDTTGRVSPVPPSATARFAMDYEFLSSGLTFVSRDQKLVAGYRIRLQFFDRRGELATGDVWQREVVSGSTDSIVAGSIVLPIPPGRYRLKLRAEDVQSSRYYEAEKDIDARPAPVSGIRFFKGDRPNPRRRYAAGDTLTLSWEVYNHPGAADWSTLSISKNSSVVFSRTDTVGDYPRSRFTASDPMTGWETGEYRITVAVTGAGHEHLFRRTAVCTVAIPFYLSDRDYRSRVDELIYITSNDEIERLRVLPVGERLAAWQDFWKKKNPVPGSPDNEFEEDYFSRIEYCISNFSKGDRGFRSDRARVYMQYGPPDQIESHPIDIDRPPFEQWFYYSSSLEFTFIDKTGVGRFDLADRSELR